MLIPLKDGTMLAARIWLPDDAEQNPVPAILEYLPYRKRDGTYERDALTHPYLAGYGYAGVRVDIRGCGEWRDCVMRKGENRCADCGGKFGLVVHRHDRLKFCRKACKDNFLAKLHRDQD